MARDLLPLTAEPTGSGRIDVTWEDYGNIPLFLSYRYSAGKQWSVIEIPSGENRYAFVGLVPGAVYEFQLFSLGRAVSEIVVAEVDDDSTVS